MAWLRSGDRTVDTRSMWQRAARAASGFASLGIGAGDTVAIFLRNDIPHFEASFAAEQLGAYATPINWHSVADEARYLFRDSKAKAIVIHADFIPVIGSALPPGVPVFVVATPSEIAAAYGIPAAQTVISEGMTDWNGWVEGFEPYPRATGMPLGSMIYTSGTTGRPKGVRRLSPTPEQYQAAVRSRVQGWGFTADTENPARITAIMTGPMYHSAPNAYGLFVVRLGGNLVLQPRFDAEDLLRMIETYRATHLHMVPIMFSRLLKLPGDVRRRYDCSSLRSVAHGAAPISIETKRAMIDWWGPILYEYYGGTETSIVTICTSEEWLRHPGTVGRPAEGAVIRILDENGQELPTGGIGDIASRLATIPDFAYHGDKGAAARQAVSRGDLISLGDIGYFDEDGYLHLCDRSAEVVISGGVNIYPAEIEVCLLALPGVADCAVIGIPDAEYGEKLCAFVQRQPGTLVTGPDVQAHLRKFLASYKVPRVIEFRDNLPREDSGKIFKRRLRDEFWQGAGKKI